MNENMNGKIKKSRKCSIFAYSMVEMLVVIAVFSLIAILLTQSLVLTFNGASKSEASSNAQNNLRYAMSIIERGLYNAQSITSTCDGTTAVATLSYIDGNYFATTFSCATDANSIGYIASGSARITNTNVDITACQFTCSMGTGNSPSQIQVELTAVDNETQGAVGSTINLENTILLRSY